MRWQPLRVNPWKGPAPVPGDSSHQVRMWHSKSEAPCFWKDTPHRSSLCSQCTARGYATRTPMETAPPGNRQLPFTASDSGPNSSTRHEVRKHPGTLGMAFPTAAVLQNPPAFRAWQHALPLGRAHGTGILGRNRKGRRLLYGETQPRVG